MAEAMSQEFASQYEEQEDARRRAAHTGEELFRVGSLLIAFELPIRDDLRFGPALVASPEPLIPFPMRVSKVFADEACIQIIDEANRDDISIPCFYAKHGERFGLDKNTIRRRFTRLVDIGWLKVVGHKTGGHRRGATEYFYRATGPALCDEEERGPWANVSKSLARTDDWKTFAQLSEWVKKALMAGTFNRRDEMCLAWSILSLDQRGWEKLVASLEALLTLIYDEQEQAEIRMEKSGEEPIAFVTALGAFETPEPTREP